jgi:hypothetical protein
MAVYREIECKVIGMRTSFRKEAASSLTFAAQSGFATANEKGMRCKSSTLPDAVSFKHRLLQPTATVFN